MVVMSGPSEASVRQPAVAGRFYPAEEQACRQEAQSYLRPAEAVAGKRWLGAIVPHAGWICSGAVSGQAVATLAQQGPVDLIVIFGAVHTPIPIQHGALDSHANWRLPTGGATIAKDMYARLESCGNLFAIDDRMHAQEHSIEVNVPLVQLAFANTPILPIEIPPIGVAELMGRKTAECIAEAGIRAIYLASTDLTHYGPSYGFTPAGVGPAAINWAKENDRRLLNLIEKLDAGKIVPEVQHNHNACGAGAVAALLGACRQLGANSAQVLWHTNSYETLAKVHPQPPTHAVGYAAVVVG